MSLLQLGFNRTERQFWTSKKWEEKVRPYEDKGSGAVFFIANSMLTSFMDNPLPTVTWFSNQIKWDLLIVSGTHFFPV